MQSLDSLTCPYCGELNDRSDDLCDVDLRDDSQIEVECQHCQKSFSYVAHIQILVTPSRIQPEEICWEDLNPQIQALRYSDGDWYAYADVCIQEGYSGGKKLQATQLAWSGPSLSEYRKDKPLYGRSDREGLYSHQKIEKVVEWRDKHLIFRPE